jgi:hypothetical protein
MKERITVPGKGQDCDLSAFTANRKSGTAQTQKFET